ncbi:GNAT family N-acetyltransferase [Sulfitobacter sp. LCG007]
MSLRVAAGQDIPAMQTFLGRHADSSMFLRSNLSRHGIGDTEHPDGTTFWIHETADRLDGVLGVTNGGYLMAQAPDAPASVWKDWASALGPGTIRGMTGEDGQVLCALEALRLPADFFSINHAEPLYSLELDRLADSRDVVRPPTVDDRTVLTGWYTSLMLETGLVRDPDRARAEAETRAQAAETDGTRLLIEDGVPVATVSLNAQVADMVQVGGVFVPASHRNRGLGRRVTAARLVESRALGARKAVLFSNNDAASRGYEAIGFDLVGAYRVAMLKAPYKLGETT